MRWIVGATAAYGALCAGLTAGSILLTPDCASVEERYDIAVVLGGGAEGERRVQQNRGGRIHAAIELWHDGQADQLHLTGAGDGQSAGARLLARLAAADGVPESRMSLEDRSLSTLQNAVFSRPDLPPDAKLVIVTEAFHAWRAWASFAWAGRPADICASDDPGRARFHQSFVLGREVAAWGLNIVRAGIWSLAGLLGLEDRMNPGLLA